MTLKSRRLDVDSIPPLTLAPADAEECLTLGMTPEFAVQQSVALSMESWIVEDGHGPVLLGGWAPHSFLGPNASVWMFGTERARFHIQAVARLGMYHLDQLLTRYDSVFVTIAEDHVRARRWAEWLGFHRFQHGRTATLWRATNEVR